MYHILNRVSATKAGYDTYATRSSPRHLLRSFRLSARNLGIRPTTSRTSIPTGSEPMGSKRAGLFSQLFSPMVLKPKSNRSRQPGPARWSKPHKVSSLSTNRASRRTSISVKKWSIFCLVSVGMRQLLRTLTTTDEMVGSLLDVVTDEER